MLQAKSNIRLLIIDDDLGFYQSFHIQHQAYYAFEVVKEVKRGIELIDLFKPDAILLDLEFPGKHSFYEGVNAVLPLVIEETLQLCPVIVVTSAKEKKIYQRAIENGAWACLQKSEYDAMIWHHKILETITAFRDSLIINHTPSKQTSNSAQTTNDGFIAITPEMRNLKSRLKTLGEKYAHVPILILGETGVGKEVAARYLHGVKANASKLPFETINLSAYPEALLFSEIFGHKKGSFTGAINDKTGAFEKAQKGTLFLDEIGEVNPSIQVGLLNVLNSHSFRQVGATKDIRLDAHLVFATNRNLDEAIATGNFREDFYHRISDYTITIPPLRERQEEILPLIDYYLNLLCKANNHPLYRKNAQEAFSPSALEALQHFYWPGNVRELRKTIQNLIIEVDVWNKNRIDESLLPQRFLQKRLFPTPTTGSVLPKNHSEIASKETSIQAISIDLNWPIAKQTAFSELSTIEKILRESGGRKDEAAKAIGLKNDQNLRYKVLKYYKDYEDIFDNFPIICKLYKILL